jgi:hypothetical protein
VQKAVEDRSRDRLVAEDVAPLGDLLVGGEQDAASLVALSDELKEQVRGRALEWQVTELVDDEQLGLGKERELVAEVTTS